jgi:hypothetical protein
MRGKAPPHCRCQPADAPASACSTLSDRTRSPIAQRSTGVSSKAIRWGP